MTVFVNIKTHALLHSILHQASCMYVSVCVVCLLLLSILGPCTCYCYNSKLSIHLTPHASKPGISPAPFFFSKLSIGLAPPTSKPSIGWAPHASNLGIDPTLFYFSKPNINLEPPIFQSPVSDCHLMHQSPKSAQHPFSNI